MTTAAPVISRRRFLRNAGAATATAVAAGPLADPSRAAPRRRPRRSTVAVFGGGIAGLTAAHELAERGFDVAIYERRAWGGKARSMHLRETASGGRQSLPSEHGYRVEFGFYQNLPDTMRRIPFGASPNGVFDNLVPMPQVGFDRFGKNNLVLPLGQLDPRPYSPQQVIDLVLGVLLETDLPPEAVVYFVERLAVFLSSCDARRLGQWEKTTWTDFIRADAYSDDYRKVLGELPQFLQASKASGTSAKFMAWVFEMLVYSLLGFGSNGPAIRVLDAPTNEAWIDPWLAELKRLGARLRLHHELTALDVMGGRIRAARVRTSHGERTIVADWYVSAIPVERARKLWNRKILARDPRLADMRRLGTGWQNGVQFYLDRRTPFFDLFLDSPWAVAGGTQAQFWSRDFATQYGDGRVQDKLSVAIADWTRPGIVYRKAARDCTPEEVATDLWEQIKRHINKPGRPPRLTDQMLISWNIDPGMVMRDGHLFSEDALVLPTAGTERYRPDVLTAIPNLLLCGDYLNGSWEVANMEAASYNGRRAANAILGAAGSREAPATTTGPYRPPEWEPLKRIDEQRYAQGRSNVLDTADPLPAVKALLDGNDSSRTA
jgi:uncharacterized protein with NAD-binding domain and iron-sulfur cluster